MQSVTVRLDEDIDPLEVGIRSGLLWCRTASGDPVPLLAGVGEALRVRVARPDGAGGAQETLAALASVAPGSGSGSGTDSGAAREVEGPGTGPVAFAAFPFDPAAPGEVIVPEIVVGRSVDGRRWLTLTGPTAPDAEAIGAAVARLRDLAEAGPAPGPEPVAYELRSVVAPERWRDEILAPARDRIVGGELDKVVLARELVLRTDEPVDPAAVLTRLRGAYPSAILFSVDGFVGASPELLVARHGDIVRAHPLAGTAPRATDPAADSRLAAGLLGSAKDRWEHRITIDWLLDGLLAFCSYVDAEPEPSIVSLANVHHLGTLVEGRLSTPAASVLDLVAALHPTPAVGGDPQKAALALIDDVEEVDRGRYAGPVGWVDAAGNGAFAVGIRSAQLADREVRLFAGVGVVADSDPVAELAETRSKFRAMLGALLQP